MITDLPEFLINPDPNIYLSDNYIVIDLECAHYGKGFPDAQTKTADILLACYRTPDGVMHHKWGNEYELGYLVDKLHAADFIVAHNAKFELGWLARAGLDLSKVLVYDTQIAEYVIAGNRRIRLDLGSVALSYGFEGKDSFIDTLMKDGQCPSTMPKNDLLGRCVYDVDTTHKVFLKQRARLIEDGLLAVFFSRCLLTPVLADLEDPGMCLDEEEVLDLYEDRLKRKKQVEAELNTFSDGVKWSSPIQVANYLYDDLKFEELKDKKKKPIRTAGGQRTAKKDVIAKLKVKTQKQQRFIDVYNKLSVLAAELSKSLEFFYGVITEGTGIFTARFNQCITVTHRLSSSGKKTKFDMYKKSKSVQFQNFKRDFKYVFKARHDGWSIAEADAAGAEFRVAADISNDKVAIAAIRDHFDVHSYTASEVLGIPIEDVTKEQRQAHKNRTFLPLYGGTSGTEAEKKYYKAFELRYPELRATQDGWVDTALATKQLTNPITGLIVYFPFLRMASSGYIEGHTQVRNLFIQQVATADIIPVALVYKWHRMKANKMKSFMVNTIHDSDITELHPEEHDLYKEITVQAYLQDVYDYFKKVYNYEFNCPLGVEYKSGTNWGYKDVIDETLVELEPTYEEAA